MKAGYSQAEFMFLFLRVTAILPYPPPLPNYQLPIVAVSFFGDFRQKFRFATKAADLYQGG